MFLMSFTLVLHMQEALRELLMMLKKKKGTQKTNSRSGLHHGDSIIFTTLVFILR